MVLLKPTYSITFFFNSGWTIEQPGVRSGNEEQASSRTRKAKRHRFCQTNVLPYQMCSGHQTRNIGLLMSVINSHSTTDHSMRCKLPVLTGLVKPSFMRRVSTYTGYV